MEAAASSGEPILNLSLVCEPPLPRMSPRITRASSSTDAALGGSTCSGLGLGLRLRLGLGLRLGLRLR